MIRWLLLLCASTALAHSPKPPEKPGGLVREVRQFAYLADEGERMTFTARTTVRFERRTDSRTQTGERTFQAGESAVCNEATFAMVGLRNGYYEYVCTRLVDTVTVRELEPQATGMPWVDPRLSMPPRRGYTRAILGPETTPLQPRSGGGGEFRISCFASHMGFEDPIVSPGREFWHHHTVFGAPTVDRWTVDPRDYPEGLCAGGNVNRSAYWVPSVIDTRFGMPLTPAGASIYYKGTPDTLPPAQMRMLTGDPMRAEPRDPSVFPVSDWTCYPPSGPGIKQGRGDEIPVACPVGSRMVWVITFPACMDGREDSADHKSHVASRGSVPIAQRAPNGCPLTHPYAGFDISYNIHYWVSAADDVTRWRLSSDAYEWSKPAGYSGHGDWWNGWDMELLAAIKRSCHDAHTNCHQDVAPDGRRMKLR